MALDALATLVRVRKLLADMDDPAAIAHADALDCYLRGSCPSLDDACDLWRTPGQRDARSVFALAERDELVRTAAADYGLTPAAFAIAIEHYRLNAWLRDRTLTDCPLR